jgi:hypothetical protein
LFITFSGCVSDQTDQSKWTTYIDVSDGAKISHPSDWSVMISKTEKIQTNTTSITMEDIIHIYSPDTSGVIQIMGFDYPTISYADEGISDEIYESVVQAFHSKDVKGVSPLNVEQDPKSYMINGNPARHLFITLIVDDQPMTSDVYIIRHNEIYYSLSYLSIDSSAIKYSSTAKDIIMTFKTIEFPNNS